MATIGISSLRASVTAMCSLTTSTMKTAPGSSAIDLMPPSAFSSFSRSRVMPRTSFLVIRSKVPSVDIFSMAWRRSMNPLTLLKLVSVPPSQRLVT